MSDVASMPAADAVGSTSAAGVPVARATAGPAAPGLLARVLLYRRAIVRLVVLAVVATVATLLLRPRTWTASGSFVVKSGGPESLGQLAGIASQFGVNIGALGGGGYPPRFYSALMTSDQTLETVLAGRSADSPQDSVLLRGLPDVLKVKGDTPAERREKTVRKLRRDVIGAIYDQRTGLTTFQVRTRSRETSAALARALLQELDRFNGERHRSQASAERRFIESRRQVVADELRSVELRMVDFLNSNRAYEGSPRQSYEYERLRRRAGDLQQVADALTRSYEQARIEEVRDTPVLTVVDPPEVPTLADERSLGAAIVAATALALLAGIGGVLALQLLGRARVPGPTDPRTPSEALRALGHDLRRPWRLLV